MTLILFSKSWYPAGLNWPVQVLPRGHEISCHSSSTWAQSIDDADAACFLQRSNEGGEFMAVGPLNEQAHDGDPVPHLSAKQTTLHFESRDHRHYSIFPNN